MKTDVDFLHGGVFRAIMLFSLPLIAQSLLQSLYNVVDSIVVGKFLGEGPLAAVGSAYSLMTLLGSVMIGLSLGSGVVFSFYMGKNDGRRLAVGIAHSFVVLGMSSLVIMVASYLLLDRMIVLMRIPSSLIDYAESYLKIVFAGIPSLFLTYWASAVFRSRGNSTAPFATLLFSFFLNVVLDVLFIAFLDMGIAGAALATTASEYVASAILCLLLFLREGVRLEAGDFHPDAAMLKEIFSLSFLVSLQQTVMNFGILMVQSLVNSYGPGMMAAFSIGVKVDGIAYLPLQEYGNGLSYFLSANRGKGDYGRIGKGILSAFAFIFAFGLFSSLAVNLLSSSIASVFLSSPSEEIVGILSRYLLVEGSFYVLIGLLFFFYAYFRSMGRPGMSLVLTAISLGLRVLLAYTLSSSFLGSDGIFLSIPVGWLMADVVGFAAMGFKKGKNLLKTLD